MPKYKDSNPVLNDSDIYSELFERRGITKITQYRAKHFNINKEYPIELITHVWSLGDKYYKLANKYYGDVACWWIIAYFNKKPTDAHLEFGDEIYIPMPLEEAKKLFGENR